MLRFLPFLLIAAHAWPAAFPASRPEIPPHRFPVTPDWYHGAPLGNGDLGVIVYGRPGEILYTIGKNDVWDRRYNPKPEPKQAATIQVRLLKPDDADGAAAEHELDLERAALLTTTPAFHAECYVPKTGRSFVLSLRNVKEPVEIILSRHRDVFSEDIPAPVTKVEPPLATLIQDMPAEETYPQGFRTALAARLEGGGPPAHIQGHERLLTLGRADARKLLGVDDGTIKVETEGVRWTVSQDCVLLVSAATTRDASNPIEAARQELNRLRAEGQEAARAAHEKEWAAFWDRSWIELSDKTLQGAWYAHQYLFNSSTRPGAVAPGLYSPWIVEDTSFWNNSYTLDYNFQFVYASALTTNHLEMMEPYFSTVERHLDDAPEFARQLGRKGLAFSHEWWADTTRQLVFTAPVETPWVALHFWEYYKHTGDREFLRRRAYPILAGCADFLASYAVRQSDGSYYLYPTHSVEHHVRLKGFDRNGAATLAMTRYILKAVVETNQTLGLEDRRLARWNELLAGLPEGYPSMQTQAGRIFLDSELPAQELGVFPPIPLENLSIRPSKEHGNHGAWMYYNIPVPLLPVWPANQIDADSPPETLLTAIRTWTHNKNEGSNDLVFRHLIAARLGIDSSTDLREDLADRLLPNGFYTMRLNKTLSNRDVLERERYFQYWRHGIYTENHALPQVINEMMLQSHRGVIRLFPSINRYLSGSFHHFRAAGGFLVSAEVDRGFVKWATLRPTTSQECRVRLPWPPGAIQLHDADGAPVEFRLDGDDLAFQANVGNTYRLTPKLMTEKELLKRLERSR